eukprot:gene7438-15215_t
MMVFYILLLIDIEALAISTSKLIACKIETILDTFPNARSCAADSTIDARNLTFKFPVCKNRHEISAEITPSVYSSLIFVDVTPMFSISMPLFNAKNIVGNSLRSLFNKTTSLWSLDIVLDSCTDNTSSVVIKVLNELLPHVQASIIGHCSILCRNITGLCNSLSFPTRIRVISAATSLWETKAENLVYRTNNPSLAYVSVQPDQSVEEKGWNIHQSLPLRIWSDVISVSANCAHNINPIKRSLHTVGRCNTSTTFAVKKGRRGDRNSTFYIRETSNRGPLIIHAKKMQQLGFFDERNFLLSNDDHDLHVRAFAYHRWITGFIPIDWKNRDGGYGGWAFRGIRPTKDRPIPPKVNRSSSSSIHNRERSREMLKRNIRAANKDCD